MSFELPRPGINADAQNAHGHVCARCAAEFACTNAHTPIGVCIVCILCTPEPKGNTQPPSWGSMPMNPPLSGLGAVAHHAAAIAAAAPEKPAITKDSFFFASPWRLAPIGAGPASLPSPDRGGSERCGLFFSHRSILPVLGNLNQFHHAQLSDRARKACQP
jgi:hypothetical protein